MFLYEDPRATTGWERNNGKGTNGGVWEWTSTEFGKVDGFVTSELYPGYEGQLNDSMDLLTLVPSCRYSTDFFDGKHHVVVSLIEAISRSLTDRIA